jgi:methionyl-tRNA formyltransferase
MSKMKIVFMGTPEFAVCSLKALIENQFNVVAVVTATDKLGGRGGKQLLQSEVKKYALDKNLPILQPEKLKAKSFLTALKALDADIFVVVAFRMLPESVWSMPPKGTINVHGSLLPKYRGAAPINWAIINGEKETGVTTFKLSHEIDTGEIIGQKSLIIHEDDYFGVIYSKLKDLGATLLIESLNALEEGKVIFKHQDETQVSHAPKIFLETCEINFNQSPTSICNFIRGLSPFPTAFFKLNGLITKVYKASPIYTEHHLQIGSIATDHKKFLHIACQNGFVALQIIKMEGKKEMNITEFLNGNKVSTS